MRFVKGLCACALFGLFANAHAADNGVYAGITVGQAETDVDALLDGAIDDSDTGFKIVLGLRPLDWIGVEMNYVNLGEVSAGGGSPLSGGFKVEQTGVDVVGLLFLDVGMVDFYAKGGLIRWDADIRFNTIFGGGRGSENGTDAVFGAGAQLRFGSFAARLEYEKFNIDTGSFADKPQMISLGLTYTFF